MILTDRKRERYSALHWLSSRTVRGGGRSCMRALDGAGYVTIARDGQGHAHVGGVQRCASVWACPVCAPVIRERRAAEVDQGVAAALAQGYRVAFVTATVSHHLGDHLADVLKLVTGSWSKVFGGRSSRSLKAAGYEAQIRNIEVTYGANGWHPHIHALIFLAPWADDTVVAEMGSRFAQATAGVGGVSMVPGPGWSYSWVETAEAVSRYMAKVDGGWGVGLEMARGDLKAGAGMSAWDLLNAAVRGDKRAETLFRIYEAVTRGRRFMVWSRGLKARFTVEDVSDAEAAIETMIGEAQAVWLMPVDEWNYWRTAGLLWLVLQRASWWPDGCELMADLLGIT